MALRSLVINNTRNLRHVELEPSPGLNVIWGDNGSGKTSILEAIQILSTGKSFRTHQLDDVLTHGSKMTEILGRFDGRFGKAKEILWQRQDGLRRQVTIDKRKALSAGEVAKILPVRAILPDSHYRFRQQSKYRRNILDWGVFHVEHRFQESWRDFQRCLDQRNRVLKQRGINFAELKTWDEKIVDFATAVTEARDAYVNEWQPSIGPLVDELLSLGGHYVSIRLETGGMDDYGLVLRQNHSQDIKLGYTQFGPHRADILVDFCGKPYGSVASQGQQKMVLLAILLSQMSDIDSEIAPVLLLDDVPSELDHQHRDNLLKLLSKKGFQVFVTTTDPNILALETWESPKLFHVKHGEVTETSC
ncbi:MAG: DNA replication/repair protein RecF [Gammaproteobacteria bacterium]|nr:DNA replication/repair protein RecF [Gammaproteobacteria bacterium]